MITDELAIANAHPLGATPWAREDYVGKFNVMTEGLIAPKDAARFLEAAQVGGGAAGGGTAPAQRRRCPAGALEASKPGIF